MGYGIAIRIDARKMEQAIKVNKSAAECLAMLERYAKQAEQDASEKNIRLRKWAYNVWEGAKNLERGTHRKWPMYGITQEMVKGTIFENC